uniref:PRKR interacting protein 1 n=1 Tax=Canis lupus dingo TaxID=286419 RepID=A0A8C0R0E8_CANLU
MKSSSFDPGNPPGHELMHIQQLPSGWRLRLSPALLADCACAAGAPLCRHMCAPPAAARPESGEAVMASSAASSVRPPRPKKEPQALVIPKNAAEEQKLKLERLMKNPVQALGLAVENSMCTGICVGESISDKTTWMPWLRSKNWMQSFRRDWRGIKLLQRSRRQSDEKSGKGFVASHNQ